MILGKTPPALVALDGRQPQNFSEWLEVATFDLVPSAQARVRPEIEAHYKEAVQHHLQNGSSASDAQAAALIDLGDARAAAKRFGQEHLTAQEVKATMEDIAWLKDYDARAILPKPWYRRVHWSYILLLASVILTEYDHPLNLRQFGYLVASILTLLFVGTSLRLLAIFLLFKKSGLPNTQSLSSIRVRSALKTTLTKIEFFTYSYFMFLNILPKEYGNSFYFPLALMAVSVLLLAFSCLSGNRAAQSSLRLRQKFLAAPEERQKLFPASQESPPPSDSASA